MKSDTTTTTPTLETETSASSVPKTASAVQTAPLTHTTTIPTVSGITSSGSSSDFVGETATTTTPTAKSIETSGSPKPPSTVRTTVPDDTFPEIRNVYWESEIINVDLDNNVETLGSIDNDPDGIDAEHNRYELDGDTLTSYTSDNTQRWQVDDVAGSDYTVESFAIGGDGYCYIGTSEVGGSVAGPLKRIDPADGSEIWSKEIGYSVWDECVVDASGHVYNLSLEGGISYISKIAPDGSIVWENKIDDFDGSNTLYIGPENEYLYFSETSTVKHRFELETGTIDSTREFEGRIEAIDADGYLYVIDSETLGKYDWQDETFVWTNTLSDKAWMDVDPHPDPFVGPLAIEWDVEIDGPVRLNQLDPDDGSILETVATTTYDSDGEAIFDVLAHPPVGGNPQLWDADIVEIYGLQAETIETTATPTTPSVTRQNTSETIQTTASAGAQTASGGATATISASAPTIAQSSPTPPAGVSTTTASGVQTSTTGLSVDPHANTQSSAVGTVTTESTTFGSTSTTSSTTPTVSPTSATTTPTTATEIEIVDATGIIVGAESSMLVPSEFDKILQGEPITASITPSKPTVTASTMTDGSIVTSELRGFDLEVTTATSTTPVPSVASARPTIAEELFDVVANGQRTTAVGSTTPSTMSTTTDAVGVETTTEMSATTPTAMTGRTASVEIHRAIADPNIALEFTPRTRTLRGGSNDSVLSDVTNSTILNSDDE